MTSSSSSSGALEAVERILNRGGDADDVLRQVVDTLRQRASAWVGIAFVEQERRELGPSAGETKPQIFSGIPSTGGAGRSQSSGRVPRPTLRCARASR